jgi:dolichyl-phosphate beta-glucosyltransferase
VNISVIIPAYNEEQRIEASLIRIKDYLDNNFDSYEIIIVDDCSTDKTGEILSRYKSDKVSVLRNDSNRGKGFSVKRGVLEARYSLVLFSDSDLSTPIEELSNFIQYIEDGYDVVIASRNLEGSHRKVKQPFYRQVMGRVYPVMANLIAVKGIKDTQCGFKLFKEKAAKRIFRLQTLDRFSFDVEILYLAQKHGLKIKEAPVVWIDKEGSKVNFWEDGIKMIFDLLIIRYNHAMKKYG